MRAQILVPLTALAVSACVDPQPVPTDTPWVPSQIGNPVGDYGLAGPSVLHFSNGSTYQTGIYEATYLGQMANPSSDIPYLILGGRSCTACDARVTIYVQSPADGPMMGSERDARYAYPGETSDYQERVIRESRAFLGLCVEADSPGIVWFDRVIDRDGGATDRVSRLAVTSAGLIFEDGLQPAPPIAVVNQRVGAGQCTEIPPLDQYTEL